MLIVDDFDEGAVGSNFLARESGLFVNVHFKISQSLFGLFQLFEFYLLVFCF
jgi:hypothetical protein